MQDDMHLQQLIDSGQAWLLEGSAGRAAMEAINDGRCMLGHHARSDYWGTYVPSRYEVAAGTPGSPEYAGHSIDRVYATLDVAVVNNDGSCFTMDAPVAMVFGRMALDLERGRVACVTIRSWESK